MCESSAYQYRRNSTYTVPYAPAIALCANARHTKAHKISRINELPPQKGIFRVISCRALGPCSCPADGAPAGQGKAEELVDVGTPGGRESETPGGKRPLPPGVSTSYPLSSSILIDYPPVPAQQVLG